MDDEHLIRLEDLPQGWNRLDPAIHEGDRIVLHNCATGKSEAVTVVGIGPTTATLEQEAAPR